MTSTPLAMLGHGFSTSQAADVVRWHALAMFGPSFLTGGVIARFGQLRVIGTGLLLIGASCMVALAGTAIGHFYLALIVLGLGWNFSFIGATSLLSNTHISRERAKVQGLNDFLVLGMLSLASFGSGALLNFFGWEAVQMAAAPALAVSGAALLWLAAAKRRRTLAPVSGP